MSKFIHSVIEPERVIAADGEQIFDLPVNPLSVILLTIVPLNESATITTYRLLEAILGAITSVDILHKGSSIISASLTNLAVKALLFDKLSIWQSNAVETNNDQRAIVVPILFGRRPYMASECFPASKKGELQMRLTFDIAAAGFDGLRFNAEAIELPGASPEFVSKFTTLTQTFAATGDNDVDLPIGNDLRGIICRGQTGFAGAAPAPTITDIELLVSNRQEYFSSTAWAASRGLLGLAGVPFPPDFRHIHSVDAAGAGREDTLEPEIGASIDDNFFVLNLDPTMDDEFTLKTEGASRVHLRVNAGATNTMLAMPIEKVPVSRFLESS